MALFDFFKKDKKNIEDAQDVRRIMAERDKNILAKISNATVNRARARIDEWRLALDLAESYELPDRYELYNLYREALDDPQVSSAVNTRTHKITLADFHVKIGDEVSDELTDLFKGHWFHKFLKNAMDSKWWGCSVVQITEVSKDGIKLDAIPELNLAPEYGAIKKDAGGGISDANIIKYIETNYDATTLEILSDRRRNLGLLNKVMPYFIWKKVFGSWSEHADRFGMPFRSVTTDLKDTERVENAKKMLQNMRGSAWAIFDETDEFDIAQESSRDAYNIYEKLIDKCDQAISKAILGQTGTTDEKSFAGSAKVHEGILRDYTKSDKKFVSYIVNDVLIPKLADLGAIPVECYFVWTEADRLTPLEKKEIIKDLAPIYNIPAEFVQDWLGIEITNKSEPLNIYKFENKYENPYPNEHSARIVSPTLFEENSFRRKSLGEGVSIILGRLIRTDEMETQSYRFDKNLFTELEAKQWLREKNISYIKFEPATTEPKNVSEEDFDQRFKDYRNTVNMSASEMKAWDKSECSSLAGVDKSPIRRNIELLETKKENWTDKHYRWAGRTIAFVSRMKAVKCGQTVKTKEGKECGCKRDISLKNWAYNPDK